MAPLAERALGVSPEAIRGRKEANPVTHGVAEAGTFLGSLLTGTGEAALVGKVGEEVAAKFGLQGATSLLGRVGAGGHQRRH